MSDSADELLSKADALLSRWRGGLPPAQRDADYPVLTDVVELPAPVDSQTGWRQPTGEPAAAVAQPSAAQISAIEARVRQCVLEAIEPMISGAVADGVHRRLEETARQLASELTGKVSEDISELVREAVSRALEGELARLRGESHDAKRLEPLR
ncbi:MAG: hypothetical protein HY661_06135 [Betaproteobacteria bacterium]|nr:hypothetical protein [Betaproteobacteria bacterium]